MLPTYFPSPPQGVWHLGPLPIRAYALFIITGIVAALMIGDRRWEARGGQRGVIYDVALWAVPFGLVGGRLYHLATDWQTYWGPGGAGFGAALRIWDGGLGIWGAVALGGVGAWIGCRRHGIPLPAFADAIAPGIVLAQAIGRLGNYFNQELYGRETTVPWGLEIFYRRDPSGYVDPHSLDGVSTGQIAFVVQPTFLYELIWDLLIFVALLYVDRRFKLGHGRLFALYVAGYCVGRFGVELLRDDTATHIAGIRINVFTSTFVFIGAVVYIILAPKGREDPETLRGTDEDAEESEESEESEPADEPAAVASAATAATNVVGGSDDEPDDSAETVESAEVAEAEAAEPETVDTETVEAETEVVEPEGAEPDVAQSEAADAQVAEPETTDAEAEESDVAADTEGEDVVSEVAEPGVAEAEELEADVADEPETEVEESAQADTEAPVADVADEPEADEAEAAEPESVVEEPAQADPEALVADVADEPETEVEEPAQADTEALVAEADEPEAAEAETEVEDPAHDEAPTGSDVDAEDREDQPEAAPDTTPAEDAGTATEEAKADAATSTPTGRARRRFGFLQKNRTRR